MKNNVRSLDNSLRKEAKTMFKRQSRTKGGIDTNRVAEKLGVSQQRAAAMYGAWLQGAYEGL